MDTLTLASRPKIPEDVRKALLAERSADETIVAIERENAVLHPLHDDVIVLQQVFRHRSEQISSAHRKRTSVISPPDPSSRKEPS